MLSNQTLRSLKTVIISTIPLRALSSYNEPMQLSYVVDHLHKYAPPSLAGSWDNVGLLVEPSSPHEVKKLLLTNDLTEPVLSEGLIAKVDMILSYHPPIFVPMKRFTQSSWKERIIIKCIENRIAVYSPHTSYDAVLGGVNDWLIKPFDGKKSPIESSEITNGKSHKVELSAQEEKILSLMPKLNLLTGLSVTSSYSFELNGRKLQRICCTCTKAGLDHVLPMLAEDPELRKDVEVSTLNKLPIADTGPGRIVKLAAPMTVCDAVSLVKSHLNLTNVRLALAVGKTLDTVVHSVAVCAGAGSSVLKGVKADLYVTGEMSHHDVLDANHRGKTVILCEHSNTERGFLAQVLKPQLEKLLEEKVDVIVSQVDSDPLKIV